MNPHKTALIAAIVCALDGCSIAKYKTDYQTLRSGGLVHPVKLRLDGTERAEWKSPTDEKVGPWTPETIVQRTPDNLPLSSEQVLYKEGTPLRCLALSGGGTRSASFSIGVMAALHQAGELDSFSVISSVSGGGYAASWFYMQQYNATNGRALTPTEVKKVRDRMFKEPLLKDGRPEPSDNTHQAYLLRNSRLMTGFDYAAMIVPQLLFAVPVHLIANGLFSWRANIGLPYDLYRARIETTFHRGPDATSGASLSLQELAQFTQASGLPVFLFNATAWPGTTDPVDLRLEEAVFTFSPLQYGSGAFGYYRYPDDGESKNKYSDLKPLRLADMIALSGAAVDGNAMMSEKTLQTLESAFAFDLGGYIANPAISNEERRRHRWLFFPFYFGYRHEIDLRGVGIYLSDGGHIENLAVYALIQRGCQDIVVVDGELDPYYRFDSYFRIKKGLREAPYRADLQIPKIEQGVDVHHLLNALNGRKITDDFPDDFVDEHLCVEALKRDPSAGGRWKRFSTEDSVMTGTLRIAGRTTVNITYAKLAYLPSPDHSTEDTEAWLKNPAKRYYGSDPWERECLTPKDEDDPVAAYYYCIKQKRLLNSYPFRVSEPFPQQPTKDQNFSPEQFNAYVTLGRRTGERISIVGLGGTPTERSANQASEE